MTFGEIRSEMYCDPPEITNNTEIVIEVDDKYYKVNNFSKDFMIINGREVPVLVFRENDFEKIDVN